jgi:hypothetical protein
MIGDSHKFDWMTLDFSLPSGKRLSVRVPCEHPPFGPADIVTSLDYDPATGVITKVLAAFEGGPTFDITEQTKHITLAEWMSEFPSLADQPVVVDVT